MYRAKPLVGLFLAACVALPGDPALAQTGCADRDSIVGKLASEYRERPHGRGNTHNGGMLEVFRSAEGSWTIIVTRPGIGGSLQSCLLAHGESWETVPPAPAAADKTS